MVSKAAIAVALAGTALVSAGAGFVASRATLAAQVVVSCPTPAAAPVLQHSLPPGPVPPLTGYKTW